MSIRPVSGLDHVGIFVRSLSGAAEIYGRLGLQVEQVTQFRRANGREVRIGIIPLAHGVKLELIEDPEALDAGVQPLNHICFEVQDIKSQLDQLRDEGVPLEDQEPRRGVLSSSIAFLDSAAADGVRIELAQDD